MIILALLFSQIEARLLHSLPPGFSQRFVAKGGVFLFGDGELGAVGQRHLKAADVANVFGVYKIALVAAQKKPSVLLFKRCHRGGYLYLALVGAQNTVLASVSRLYADYGVRQEKVVRPVQPVKVKALAVLFESVFSLLYLVKVFRVYHIVVVLGVQV